MQKKPAVAVVFETAYDAHVSKDILAVPVQLGLMLGNLPVYLLARPNPFQTKFADYLNFIPFGGMVVENNEALLNRREESLRYSSEWYHSACLQAADYANVLFLVPHFGDALRGSFAFWKKNRALGWSATTYVKLDTNSEGLLRQLKEQEAGSGVKPVIKRIVRRLERTAHGRKICAFSTESPETLHLYQKLHPEFSNRTFMVKNCPVLPRFSDRQVPQISERSKSFLAVGRLGSPPKATDILLKAWLIAATRCNGWNLRLVGSVEAGFRETWDAILKKNDLQKSVEWAGIISDRTRLWDYYTSSRVFVLPSRWESSSTTLGEAIVAGCAAICTPVGDAPLLLKDFATALVPIDNPEALAESMIAYACSETLLDEQIRALKLERKQRRWEIQLEPVVGKIKHAVSASHLNIQC